MPLQSRPIPESAIAHLPRCPKCVNGRLTVPLLCKGNTFVEDRHKWYCLCLNKELALEPAACTYFYWFKEHQIPRGPPPRGTPKKRCASVLCAPLPSEGRLVNMECIFGLCSQCCVYAHRSLIGLPRCRVSAHANGVSGEPPLDGRIHWHDAPGEPDSWPSDGTSDEPVDELSSPSPRVTRSAARHRTQSTSAAVRTSTPHSESSITPPPPNQLARRRTAVSTSRPAGQTSEAAPAGPRLAPDRVQHQGGMADAATTSGHISRHQVEEFEEARRMQKSRHTVAQEVQTRTFYLYWWHQNDEPAKYIQVTAPNWPLFHPKESEHLVTRFKIDQEFFEAFDPPTSTWVSCWKDSPARRVDLRAPQSVHYRSEGVTRAPGMPGSDPRGVKRVYDALELGESPESPSLPRTPVNKRISTAGLSHSASSSSSAGSSAGAVAFTSTSGIPFPLLSADSRSSSPFTTPSRSQQWSVPPSSTFPSSSPFSTPTSIDDWGTPTAARTSGRLGGAPSATSSPAATPFLDSPVPAWPPCMGLGSDQSGLHDASLLDTPTSTLRTVSEYGPDDRWPYLYAVDMIKGFRRMDEFMTSGPLPKGGHGAAQKAAFAAAFPGHDFKSSTYGENHKAYTNALAVPGAIEEWEGMGRVQQGKWALFRKMQYDTWVLASVGIIIGSAHMVIRVRFNNEESCGRRAMGYTVTVWFNLNSAMNVAGSSRMT
ncbi:hypothetical protein K466DRAFT_568241 [Polyporus arcularius HHB13444]|uniref:Uncharacterized protein n=1 Tax=Polyporus arcularius HHB13444 TaxID=1314778 RepID=A0A5C3P173_9APHY|nr:hypothetical protein K466DRAFT_568241 [Polyporus arcularius HHB13444]